MPPRQNSTTHGRLPSAEMYQQTGAQPGAGAGFQGGQQAGPQGGNAQGNDGKEDIQDADFEEVK